jgi:hypothetical protein
VFLTNESRADFPRLEASKNRFLSFGRVPFGVAQAENGRIRQAAVLCELADRTANSRRIKRFAVCPRGAVGMA